MNNHGTVFPETANTSSWNVFALLCTTPRCLWKCCPWGIKDFLQSPHFQSVQFDIELEPWFTGDKMFPQLFCSLLLHSQGSLTQRCFHCPCTNPAPTCFGLPEEARSSDKQHSFGWGLKWSSGNERSKPSSFSASKKEQRKAGKATQTQPSPKGFALQLQRNCSPQVPCQVFSDFFFAYRLKSALWGASKAQASACVTQRWSDTEGLAGSHSLSPQHSHEGCAQERKTTHVNRNFLNLYCKTEHPTLNFRCYYLKKINQFQTCDASSHPDTSFIQPHCSFPTLRYSIS